MTEVARNPDGTFPKGVSGNPAGRPKGGKNKITALKQDLEIAVREHMTPSVIRDIVHKMALQALEGDVQAAKLILDKTISNVKTEEDAQSSDRKIEIVISHSNVGIIGQPSETPPIEAEVIPHEQDEEPDAD